MHLRWALLHGGMLRKDALYGGTLGSVSTDVTRCTGHVWAELDATAPWQMRTCTGCCAVSAMCRRLTSAGFLPDASRPRVSSSDCRRACLGTHTTIAISYRMGSPTLQQPAGGSMIDRRLSSTHHHSVLPTSHRTQHWHLWRCHRRSSATSPWAKTGARLWWGAPVEDQPTSSEPAAPRVGPAEGIAMSSGGR